MNSTKESAEKIGYLDCYSGISGDMTLGALIDAGADLGSLREMLRGLNLGGYRLEAEKIRLRGLAGTRARVNLESAVQSARNLPDILEIIESSSLPQMVIESSSAVFRRLAEAEAVVHGTTVDKVHFHEVGAVDAIVDIVGACSALHLLGIDRLYCSPLPAARGEVETAHGKLPLPAPATLELLAGRKVPVEGRPVSFELVTPTGAALAVTLAEAFGPLPDFTLDSIGYGAGSNDPGYPNFLRILVGHRERGLPVFEETVSVLEAAIDDLNPEIYGYLMDRFFDAGALDVYYTPVQMKKNRPAVHLTVLCNPSGRPALQRILFEETSTLGFRFSTARKIMRPREFLSVQTRWGKIRVKYCPAPGGERPLQFSPEYEDCRHVAEKSGLPLKEIYRLAENLFREARQK